MIEEVFKAHQYTIAAIAAAGTVFAVITSLWLAWRANRADRTRLKAEAHLGLIASTIEKSASTFLSVRITNQGRWPLRITANFFCWKVPFKRGFRGVIPLDLTGSPLIPQKHYPTEISPRASADFYISEVKRMRGANTFADRLRFRFIRAFVQTDDGETFRVKLSPAVREVLLEDSTSSRP
jgi:hypothetical protein